MVEGIVRSTHGKCQEFARAHRERRVSSRAEREEALRQLLLSLRPENFQNTPEASAQPDARDADSRDPTPWETLAAALRESDVDHASEDSDLSPVNPQASASAASAASAAPAEATTAEFPATRVPLNGRRYTRDEFREHYSDIDDANWYWVEAVDSHLTCETRIAENGLRYTLEEFTNHYDRDDDQNDPFFAPADVMWQDADARTLR